MAHPFFDSPTFPWSLPEAGALHAILYKSITMDAEIDRIRKTCGEGVMPVEFAAAHAMWRDVLDAVAVAGCLRNLERTLRGMPKPHVIEALDKLVDVVETPPGELVGNHIFVNRISLRSALRQLAARDASKQVLVVRGEDQSGKSWTRHLIEHSAGILGQGCTYLCEGLVTNVEEVLDNIFTELGGPVPARVTTEEAWFRKAAVDMIKLASARNRGSWIVMDDLGMGPDGAPLLDPQIRHLFDQLAATMINPAFKKWFRLVLIAYPEGPLPDKWRPWSLQDRTAVADMHPEALTTFLAGWAERKSKTLAQADAAHIAQVIIENANAASANDGRSHFERVHDELDTRLGKL